MIGRVGMRSVALGITAFAACSAAHAAELREVHIDIGSSGAPLIATVHIEDYRAAPLDLLVPAAPGDSEMTRFVKSFYEIFRAGDTKRVASLYPPDELASVNEHFATPQLMTEHYDELLSARLSVVLHWGEYQFTAEPSEAKGVRGVPRYTAGHVGRCVGGTCRIAKYFANNRLGAYTAEAFSNKSAAEVEVPAQGETTLPILPDAVDAAQKATNPMVLHLKRASDQTTLAVSKVVASLSDKLRAANPKQPKFEDVAVLYSAGTPKNVEVFQRGDETPFYAYNDYAKWFKNHAPWTVSTVYAVGPDACVAVLRSDKDGALHLLPLQRAGKGWAIISDPAGIKWWWALSSSGTYRALQASLSVAKPALVE